MNGKDKETPAFHENADETMVTRIREKLKTGDNFWQLIWEPFIDRELDRNTVKRILKTFYIENTYNFRRMTRSMNLGESDYPKFMSLLYKYRIDPRK